GNPERDRRKGLGLGLAIVERLARLLDHKVELTSTCGVGSIFSVQIPLGEPQLLESAAPSRRLPANEFEGALLAIVDDDDLARASMEGLVQQWGCEAVVAPSGKEALAMLDGKVPDALVCDYRLPGGETGLEVITLIRVACRKEIPAILISGDTAPKLMRTAEAVGLPLLHKPVRPAKLRALLTHLLKTRQPA
ncbi:MAG: ATP-binding response regulator, partial [Burkholderiales bacterium]